MGEAKRKTAFVAEIDADELATRIAEAATGLRRPAGMPAAEALALIDAESRREGFPDTVPGFRRAARAAAGYLAECVANGKRPS